MDEDFSDEQIQALLKDAEARLKERNASAVAEKKAGAFKFPSLNAGEIEKAAYIQQNKNGVAKINDSLLATEDKKLADKGVRKVEDPVTIQKRKEEKTATAGPKWFNLPKTDFSNPTVKRDLQILNMRTVLDPHRHYKKDKKLGQAEYSVMGEIIEGPTDFFSSRINKKDRKKTFVEEVLATEAETGRAKRKYSEIQQFKGSGKKGFYKALQAKRAKKFK